jgi:2,3-bisphosphoglycerate-independent phosphoglycerate mutase
LSHPIQVEGATGDYHTNLGAKKDALVRHLTPVDSSYSFGFLHVKAVDDAGHDKNRGLKVRARCTRYPTKFQHQVEFLNRIDTMIGELITVRVVNVVVSLCVIRLQELAAKERETGIR